MIEVKELTKSFGTVRVVGQVSFTVSKGEAIGFLGPNGAGKTTTFRMMAGTLAPDSGEVLISGMDLFRQPLKAKMHLGYMAENAPLYPELSGRQYLNYRAELRRVKRAQRDQVVRRAAEKSGALKLLDVRIGHLSKGYRQRMALADALLCDPLVLLLDEPTSGLDPNQVLETRKLISELSKEHAVILSTHVLSEVEATCSRAIVIDRGRIVGQGSLQELKKNRTHNKSLIFAAGTQSQVEQALSQLAEAKVHVQMLPLPADEGAFQLEIIQMASGDLARAVRVCVNLGLDIEQAGPLSTALDEVFAHLTRQESP